VTYISLGMPPVLFLGLAFVLGAPHRQPGVSDELERLIGVLIPIVAALLSPMLTAIVLLFRQLLNEMRANRITTTDVTKVVMANTAAFDANTKATDRLAAGFEAMSERLGRLEARMERMEQLREHRAHLGGPPA
jgi:hypothetical protein